MAESVELAHIRREAFLRALHRAAQKQSVTILTTPSLSQELSLHLPQLGFLIRDLVSEGLVTLQGGLDSGAVVFTEKGLAEANEVINRRSPSRAKTRILCIDTELETLERLKDAGYTVSNVSMGYRTGKRDFPFPAPNEVDLVVCDLKHPACFDRTKWGPGFNNNFKCTVVPFDQVSNSFSTRNGRIHAQHPVVYESQLGQQIPGAFGPKEVKRPIAEAGVQFLLFLNWEWLQRIDEFPNWCDITWSLLPTSATQVEIGEPLSTLLPELGKEIKFKFAIRHRIEKGPQSGGSPSRALASTPVVKNNIGDVFGQFVQMGKGTIWLLPATHQNLEIAELFASRLEVVRELVSRAQEPQISTVLDSRPATKAVARSEAGPKELVPPPCDSHPTTTMNGKPRGDSRDVFVIHGGDERLRSGMFQFLRALDLNPIEWTRAVELTGKAAPYVGDVLDAAFSHAQAVVVLFSPDDVARLRPDLCGPSEPSHETNFTHQARPNVLFESGMAMARHPDRTVLVEIGTLRPFSDIGGRLTVRMDDSPKSRQALAQRLQKAGCSVNLSGTDWQTAGDMKPPEVSPPLDLAPPEPQTANQPAIQQNLLADVISELEDNLKRARAPRGGDAYARPTSDVWKKNRNRAGLPGYMLSQLASVYDHIENWRTIVESGVHPNMGSQALDNTAAILKTVLPSVIEELKRFL